MSKNNRKHNQRILWFICYIILISVISCRGKKIEHPTCKYTIDSLSHYYDTSAFVIKNFKNEQKTDFIEPRSKYGEAGIYTFDHNGTLRFYGFLTDSNNRIQFSIQYDSTGEETSRTDGDVVSSYFRKAGQDSIHITPFFFSINYSYSNILLRTGNQKKALGELYQSNLFSNIFGKTITMPLNDNMKNQKLYVEGIKYNKCNQQSNHFVDSIWFPSELFNR